MGGCFTCIGPAVIRRARACRGAAADEEVHLNLAYHWFCRLDLDGKVHAFPVDRNQRRLQRFCFLRIAWAVQKTVKPLGTQTSPPPSLAKNGARPAPRNST